MPEVTHVNLHTQIAVNLRSKSCGSAHSDCSQMQVTHVNLHTQTAVSGRVTEFADPNTQTAVNAG